MAPTPLLQKHMPQLDILRGIAIALVVLYHGIYWTQPHQPNHLANAVTQMTLFGWLGVNLFFVLSGFLITGILLDSKERSNYFSGFYIRRALRILPAYFLTIIILILLNMLSIGGLLQALTFTANYPLIPASRTYGLFWSLSVEEQFYLLWPLVVFLCSRRTLTSLALFICLAEPLLRGLAQHYGHHEGLVHSATFLIADNLAFGALAAIFVRSRYGTRGFAIKTGAVLMLASVSILVLGVPHGLLHRTNALGAALQVEPFEMLFTALILLSLAAPGSIYMRPVFAPLRWLGDISYGLYLIHLIIFEQYNRVFHFPFTFEGRVTELLGRFFICAVVSIGLAWFSRRFYEERFLRLKGRLAPRGSIHVRKSQANMIA